MRYRFQSLQVVHRPANVRAIMADEHDDVVGHPNELRAKERLKHFNKMLVFIMLYVTYPLSSIALLH